MSDKKRINVATALNHKYVRYIYVMLTSLFKNQPDSLEIHIYLLHSDLTEEDQVCLIELVKSMDGFLHLLFVSETSFPEQLPTNTLWTLEIYYRLMLPDILPEDVERLLYLDVDIIVCGSLEELFSLNFEDNLIYACKDSAKLPFPAERAALFREQIQRGFTYFNSGVLLLNIPILRKKYSFRYYMDLTLRLLPQLWAPDQDILNYVHWNEVRILGPEYNFYAKPAYNQNIHYEEVKENAVIVHFTGQKPWEGQYVHYDIEQLWWDYAKMTPFYDEFMEEFIRSAIHTPLIYDTMERLSEEKKKLNEELKKSVSLCQQLVQMLKGE